VPLVAQGSEFCQRTLSFEPPGKLFLSILILKREYQGTNQPNRWPVHTEELKTDGRHGDEACRLYVEISSYGSAKSFFVLKQAQTAFAALTDSTVSVPPTIIVGWETFTCKNSDLHSHLAYYDGDDLFRRKVKPNISLSQR